MEGLNADTIAAMSIWSLWVAAGLALVGWPHGPTLSVTYLGLAVPLWAGTDVPWRAYLAGALALHVLTATRAAFAQFSGGQFLASAVSLAGLVWLSIGGGVRYWLPLVAAALIALVAVVFVVVLDARNKARERAVFRASMTSARRPDPRPDKSVKLDLPTSARLVPHAGLTGDTDLDREVAWPTFDHVAFAAALNPASVHDAPLSRPDPVRPADQGPDVPLVPKISMLRARPHAPLLHAEQSQKILPAVLDVDVTAHPGNTVRAVGLAQLFDPAELTVSDSMAVVCGDRNRVSLRTHYRIRRFDISLLELRSGFLLDAVRALAAGGSVAQFQERVREHLSVLADGPSHFLQTIKAPRTLTISSCNNVQVGDHSRMAIDNRFVIDTTTVPILRLLATDPGLVEAFAGALRETQPGPATAGFLRLVVRRTGDLADLALLDSVAELATPDTWISALFGAAKVTGAAVVMLGADNELTDRLTVHRPGLEVARLSHALNAMRPPAPAPTEPDAAPQVVAVDTVPGITRLPEIDTSVPHPGPAAPSLSEPGDFF